MVVPSGISGLTDVFRELQSGSDRAVAVVGGALIDEIMRRVLMQTLRADDKVQKDVLDGNGPMSTFSARINMSYLLGLYGKEVHHDLHILRKVRNEFAHELTATFSTNRIKDLVGNLKLVDRYSADIKDGLSRSTTSQNRDPKNLMLWDSWVFVHDRDEALNDPKERFLVALQIFAWVLSGNVTQVKIGSFG